MDNQEDIGFVPPAQPPDVFVALRIALGHHFPRAFPLNKLEKVPLKVGIHLDIVERWPEINRDILERVLRTYTGGPSYLRKLNEGAVRIDLDGLSVGEVSARQANWAKMLVSNIKKKESRILRQAMEVGA